MMTLGRFICRQYEYTRKSLRSWNIIECLQFSLISCNSIHTLSAYNGFAVFRFRNKHEGGEGARRKDKVVQRSLKYHVVYTNPGFPS